LAFVYADKGFFSTLSFLSWKVSHPESSNDCTLNLRANRDSGLINNMNVPTTGVESSSDRPILEINKLSDVINVAVCVRHVETWSHRRETWTGPSRTGPSSAPSSLPSTPCAARSQTTRRRGLPATTTDVCTRTTLASNTRWPPPLSNSAAQVRPVELSETGETAFGRRKGVLREGPCVGREVWPKHHRRRRVLEVVVGGKFDVGEW